MKSILRVFWPFWFSVGLVSLDQFFKFLIGGAAISLWGDYFGLVSYHNSGFAFGLPLFDFLIAPLSGLILFGLLFWVYSQWKNFDLGMRVCVLLILSGGTSNFFERLVLGYVRDPIKIFNGYWNLADFMIVLGGVCWWWYNRKHRRIN